MKTFNEMLKITLASMSLAWIRSEGFMAEPVHPHTTG